jgi:hypothetical protein
MKLLHASKLLILTVLTFGMTMPGIVYSNVAQGASNRVTYPQFVKNWNKVAKNWPSLIKDANRLTKELKKSGLTPISRFEKQDESYEILKAVQQPEFPTVAIKGDAYEFTSTSDKNFSLTIKDFGNNKYSFNGKEYQYDENLTLEANVQKVTDMLTPKAKVSFWDALFMPKAQAFEVSTTMLVIGIVVAVAALVGAFFLGKNSGKSIVKGVKKFRDRNDPIWRATHDNDDRHHWHHHRQIETPAAPAGTATETVLPT